MVYSQDFVTSNYVVPVWEGNIALNRVLVGRGNPTMRRLRVLDFESWGP